MIATTAPLLVTLGCPGGIGPEVALRAASQAEIARPIVLLGDAGVVAETAARVGLPAPPLVPGLTGALPAVGLLPVGRALSAEARAPGRWTAEGGQAQLAWIDAAADALLAGDAAGMVTGPASKEAVVAGGACAFRGHTEHLAARFGAEEVVMAFWSPRLTTSLVTTHLPLAAVPTAITATAVAAAIFWTADLLARLLPDGGAPIAVCGLNPHAGEGGLLGHEEGTIAAGIAEARRRMAARGGAVARWEIAGPLGAETVFRVGASGGFSAAIAMYHDQGTIPMKLLGFGEAVNVSLGLPYLRTSVDHGTGYDRAGKGIADAAGMRAALELADRLAAQ